MKNAHLTLAGAAALAAALLAAPLAAPLAAQATGQTSSALENARVYLARIARIDEGPEGINAVLGHLSQGELAAAIAPLKGPLGARSVLVKDNIETREWPTTAGSLALAENRTGRDAPLIARLRAAGGLVLGKTNLSEWANIRSSHSTSGWSGVGGLTRNPFATDRNACGSSSGSGAAVAARLSWAAIGTETDGSITCPASLNGVVGFKPTVGLVSRTHVVPISASQDTAGPMARSVHDAALLLSAIAGSDSADPATKDADRYATDFTRGLAEASLKGVRIGVMRNQIGSNSGVSALFEQALRDLAAKGAVLVDIDYHFPEKMGERELHVMLFELRRGLGAYLGGLKRDGLPASLGDVLAFNRKNTLKEMRWFGQDLFEKALEAGDEAAYREDREANIKAAGEDGIDRLMRDNNLAALIAPTAGPAWTSDLVNGDHFNGSIGAGSLPAIAGYPHLSVPMGAVEGLPVGLSIFAGKWDDSRVLKIGAAYERARTAKLPSPGFTRWTPPAR